MTLLGLIAVLFCVYMAGIGWLIIEHPGGPPSRPLWWWLVVPPALGATGLTLAMLFVAAVYAAYQGAEVLNGVRLW